MTAQAMRTKRLNVPVDEQEHDTMRRAAARRNLGLMAWARSTLLNEARRVFARRINGNDAE